MSGFSEVNELADLIKDNLYNKHLILSAEELLVDILQDNSCLDKIVELQPMTPYHRLLLHRLADIYGFAHESVGEGDDRHLVLMRCTDTAIPPVRVSDILWQQNDYQSPTTFSHILKKKDSPAAKPLHTISPTTPLEEREAAYQAARERIFSTNDNDDKEVVVPRSRRVPAVARRMIAHALGQNICSTTSSIEKLSLDECREKKITEPQGNEKSNADDSSSTKDNKKSSNGRSDVTLDLDKGKEYHESSGNPLCTVDKGGFRKASTFASSTQNSDSSNRRVVGSENLEEQRNIAAKRIFSHALGLQSSKRTNDPSLKWKQGNR